MTRRYGDPILVAEHSYNEPRCFIWRGTTYRVRAVLGMWHLRDRWWETATLRHTGSLRAPESDRQYYRLECLPELLCDLYFDTASDRWILDRIYD